MKTQDSTYPTTMNQPQIQSQKKTTKTNNVKVVFVYKKDGPKHEMGRPIYQGVSCNISK